MTFRIGQKVVCINCDGMLGLIKPSDVLTITEIWQLFHITALSFAEVQAPQPYIGFYGPYFRPAVDKKTDIGFAREILRKASRTKETSAC